MYRLCALLLMVGLVTACSGEGTPDAVASTSSLIPTTTSAVSTLPPTTSTTVVATTPTTPTTIATNEPFLVTLASGPASVGPVSGAANADGFPVVAYVSSDGELRLLTCSDVRCEGPIDEVPLGNPGEVFELDLALRPDGAPVVVVLPLGSEGMAVMYSCAGSACSSIETAEIGDPEGRIDYPSIVVGSDGLPRVVYITASDPMAVKVASCITSTCEALSWATIDVLPSQVFTGAPSVRLDSSERLLVGYWYSMGPDVQQSRIAICEDPSCTTSPTIQVLEGGVFPQTTQGDTEDEFQVWYQTGSESLPVQTADPSVNYAVLWSEYSDFMVAECSIAGCQRAKPIEVGEDWLFAQAAGGLRLFTTVDGMTGAFFNHTSRATPTLQLQVTICTAPACGDGITQVVGVDGIDGPFFDVLTAADTPPQVVFRGIDETIGLYICSPVVCIP